MDIRILKLNALGGTRYIMCKPLQRRSMLAKCSWFAYDSCGWISPYCGTVFFTACCVRSASLSVSAQTVSFALEILICFRTMADRADDPGAEDPLACGLPPDPKDGNVTDGMSSKSQVLLAVITFCSSCSCFCSVSRDCLQSLAA